MAGVVGAGIGKGVVKGKDSELEVSKSGFEIADNNSITGHQILGIHKDESNNTIGNYIVEGTKPSTKDKVINVETQYYENPGHHDLKDGNMPYNSTKAIIPDNHVKLWENSVKIDSDPKNRWAIENKDGKVIYHRFQDDGNGNFHWNGSTKGITSSGKERNIKISDVPSDLIKMVDSK